MRQRFDERTGEFIGWKFSRTEAIFIMSNIIPFVKPDNDWDNRYMRTMYGKFRHELPFISVKQKEAFDRILKACDFPILSQICQAVPMSRWSGDIDSLVRFIRELAPMMSGEFVWFYEYNPAAYSYGKSPLEVATSDYDAYLGFEVGSDARFVARELESKMQEIV